MPLSVVTQWALFQKILVYDRNLDRFGGKSLNVGVVYQKKDRLSLQSRDQFHAAVAANPELKGVHQKKGFNFSCVDLALEDSSDLAAAITELSVDLLYITPMRTLDVELVAAVSRAQQRTTLTGVPDYVEAGLAVGLGVKGEKPRILVNLKAAKAEGANFNSRLLKLAKVYK